jgi:tetratricopeptide (TPR) repeat protein
VLSNLGAICYLTGRIELGHEYYRRADALRESLPAELNESAEGLASQAGSLTNQAIVAGSRGQYERAIELLEASIPTHKEALAKWPSNPVALDCYYICLSTIVEFHLVAGRAPEAAAAVERCVQEFPDRLLAYCQGASHLLGCAKLAHDQNDAALAYHKRAHQLIEQSVTCTTRRPDMVSAFALFLLMCEDTSFRDPARALELAQGLVQDVPERADAWSILALAHYRAGDWPAADEALQKSTQLSPDGQPADLHWLLGAMIHWQSGRHDESRQWIAKVTTRGNQDAIHAALAAEAAALIEQLGAN